MVTFLKLVLSAATLSLSFQKTFLRKQKHTPYWGTVGWGWRDQCTLRGLRGPDSGHQRTLPVPTSSWGSDVPRHQAPGGLVLVQKCELLG